MEGVPGLFKHATIVVVDLYHQDLHFEAQLQLYLAFLFAQETPGFWPEGLLTQHMWFYGLLH